jgi:spore maturation protein CgeB
LDGARLVLVHEWNQPELVRDIGRHRASQRGYHLLFHDTHHRAVSAREELAAYDLRDYDGVLAFGGVLRDTYLERDWIGRAWTWHEAADTRRFHPRAAEDVKSDLVWIGNWGDGERSHELQEFLLEPVGALKLSATIHGVRYPDDARAAIARSGARYGGFLPNFEAPAVFAEHKLTVHVPRRFYTQTLPGIPTIRVFEALACGIPLVCAPWDDAERLFAPGEDYLVARDGTEMKRHLRDLLHDDALASALTRSGLARIAEHHTCAHRVDELFAVQRELEAS